MANEKNKKDLTDLVALQARRNAQLQEELKVERELAKLRGEKLTATNKILSAREKQLKNLQEEQKLLFETATKRAEEKKKFDEAVAAQKKIIDYVQRGDEEKAVAAQAEIDRLHEENELRLAIYDLSQEELEAARAINVQREEGIKKLNEAAGSMKINADRFATMVGIGDEFNKTVLGGMIVGLGSVFTHLTAVGDKTESLGDRFKMMGEMLFGPEGALSLSKVTGMIMNQTKTMLISLDSARAAFFEGTAAADEFGDSVYDVSRDMVAAGLGMDSVGESMKALYNGLTVFKGASEATRKELGIFVSTLEEIGINSTTVVQNLQFMTKSLGMSASEAKAATEELVHFARSIEMSADVIQTDLAEAMTTLAAYGDQAINVFKGLEIQSRATGLSVSTLLGVSTQFDTFDQAAQAVGRLNGILGGAYLNSVEMVYATEEERLEMLRETLDASGKSWDAMSKFEKQTLSTAAGFNNVADAAAFFNTTLDDPAVQKKIKEQEELAAMAKKTDDIMTKIDKTMQQFAISLEPLIDFIRLLIDGFSALNNVMGGYLAIGILVAAIGWKVTAMKKAKAIATAEETAATVALETAQATQVSLEILGAEMKALSTAMSGGKIATTEAESAATKSNTGTEIGGLAPKASTVALKGASGMGPFGFLAFGFILGAIMALIGAAIAGGFAAGTPPGGAPGGLAMVNELGPEGFRRGGMTGIIPGGPRLMNLNKGDEIIPNKNLGGGPSAKDIGQEVASAVQGALSVNVDVSAPDGKQLFQAVNKQETRNFKKTMANRATS